MSTLGALLVSVALLATVWLIHKCAERSAVLVGMALCYTITGMFWLGVYLVFGGAL